MEQILEKDVLLHYPYQSIRPFLRMLSEAANDPQVVSIRMTLYRLARDSKVVEAAGGSCRKRQAGGRAGGAESPL